MRFWSRVRARRPDWARRLTNEQEAEFRQAVDSLLFPHGYAYQWTEDGLRLSISEGLDTIASVERIAGIYAETSPAARAALLADHFSTILAPRELPQTWKDAEPNVGARLFARAALAGGGLAPDVWRVLTDSVVAALTIRDATGEGTLSRADLDRWHVASEDAWQAALRNVHAEPLLADERTPLPSGGEVRALFTASPRGAARSIEIDRYFDATATSGAVLCVPVRDVVIFHAIQTRPSFEAAVSFMASACALLYKGPGGDSLSPDLIWWLNGVWTTISYVDGHGILRRKPTEELDRYLQRSTG